MESEQRKPSGGIGCLGSVVVFIAIGSLIECGHGGLAFLLFLVWLFA